MNTITGTGIGFRRDIADEIISLEDGKPDFIEVAPENWMGLGGYWRKKLDEAVEKYPLVCHGLSLSIGSPDPLDMDFLNELKKFLDHYQVSLYSEHLSYSKCDNAHLYDLLPIPFRQDAVDHIAERIRVVQDFLERPLILENVSYYTPLAPEMKEEEFVSAILNQSDCRLLLDVNNVYVNSFNHTYSSTDYINALPLDRVAYIHMAGHEQVAPDLIIDTHGQNIIDPVYQLFEETLPKLNPVPVLLERDFNIPDWPILQNELSRLRSIGQKAWQKSPTH
ncbi:DUF692 domain-containing protein [bacterium SCSIO 12741]|nr:DUF692 domain-containing protein [bacterium SCSIO 12741]